MNDHVSVCKSVHCSCLVCQNICIPCCLVSASGVICVCVRNNGNSKHDGTNIRKKRMELACGETGAVQNL